MGALTTNPRIIIFLGRLRMYCRSGEKHVTKTGIKRTAAGNRGREPSLREVLTYVNGILGSLRGRQAVTLHC